MSKKTIQLSFFVILTLGLLILTFFVFQPYLGIIFISIVLSVVFYPLYQKFVFWFKGRQGLAAVIILFIIVVAIVIPTMFISASIFSEAVNLYNSMVLGGGVQKLVAYADSISTKFGQTPFNEPIFQIDIESYFKNTLNWIISHFDSIFAVALRGMFGFFLMLISIYYLLRSGPLIKKNIILWSPLPDSYDEEVLTAFHSSIDAVLRGRLLVAVAQGFFLGLGFFIFGVNSPILWGFVAAVASLIPILGTAVVTVPASLYLFLSGNPGSAIGILVWGALAVGLIDDLLSVIILKRSIKINPLVILLSILGGVQFFGPVGFLAGPILVSALLSLLKIYPPIMFYNDQKLQI